MANYLSPIGNGVSFIDDNGDPRSGAKLFVYSAGSTTKVTTYKNEAGSASHTNPIILDANGMVADPIWITGGSSYKFVLAPSNDTDPPTSPYETWDDIDGINDASTSVDQWVSGPTPTYVSGTTLTLVGDQTSTFHIGRRVKTTDSGGTDYGTIINSAYTTLTTLTLDIDDSGSLDSGLSAIEYSLLSATNNALPRPTERTILSTDAGASEGPSINLERYSASPAASDLLGALAYLGRNSAAAKKTYAKILADIVDATAASEDGRILLQTIIAGTLATRGYIQHGMVMGSATGGDQGAGTINATGVYDDGVLLRTAGLIYLGKEVASNSASLIFNSSDFDWSTYDVYLFVGVKLRPENNDITFEANISNDDGSTWLTTYQAGGAYQQATTGPFTPTAFGSATSTNIPLSTGTANGVVNGDTGPFNFTMKVFVPSAASYPAGQWEFDFRDATNGLVTGRGAFHYPTGGAWNAIRFRASTGNITSGTIFAYGLRNA